MNVIGIGFDLVDLAEFENSLLSDAFKKRVFTDKEITIAEARRKSSECFAGKFAVKEALMKCLGAGIRQGIWFSQIEVLNAPTGAPVLQLYKDAKSLMLERGIVDWQISISHTQHTAGAVVLALGKSDSVTI